MRDVTSRWRWLIAVMVLVAMVGAACGDDNGESEPPAAGEEGEEHQGETFDEGSTMAKIQEEGKVTIGVKFDVPPFGFDNPQSGEVEGFDVDLGKIIAEELGAEPKFIEAISDNRIPYLESGRVDLILSTMTITTDRDAEIDFSRPYYIAHGRILVPNDSDIAGIEDLGGKTVCTARGSTYESTLSEKAPDADLKLVDSYSECLELIQNGAVDAVSTDDVILTGMVIQDDSLKLVGDDLTTEPYGVGIPEGQTDMAEFVSHVIDETFASGEWDELYETWVGQYTGEQGDDPGGYTLEDAYKLFPCSETC